MRDLALDASSGDLVLDGGQVLLTSGLEAVEQKLRVRLRLVLGEWLLDESVGMPYFTVILANKNLTTAQAMLRSAVQTCPGVAEILAFDFSVDARTRVGTLSFTVRTTDDEILTISDFRPAEVL